MGGGFLGLDFGTSGARACLIDARREILFEARAEYALAEPASWREALFELLAEVPAPLRRSLHAIAVAGTSTTALLCDGRNGPIGTPLLYHDARATEEAALLRGIAPPDHIAASPTSSLAKLLWWSRQPEFAHARHFAQQADWVAQQLHGQPGVSDYHNSLKLGYDPQRLCYPAWLLGLAVAPLLPRILAPGQRVARASAEVVRRFGLAADCLVRAGTTDSIAAFLASGACEPGEAVTSLGSTLVLKLLSTSRVESGRHGVYSHRLGNLWLTGGASNSGGAVLKSFFDAQTLQGLSRRINPAEPSGLDYYPLLQPGERFPVNDPALQPRLAPRPPDDMRFLQGLLEGMARIEAQGYHLLQTLGATPLRRVLSSGGGAGNTAWTAIRARLLEVPVRAAAQGEAAFGAALLAAGMLAPFSAAGNPDRAAP